MVKIELNLRQLALIRELLGIWREKYMRATIGNERAELEYKHSELIKIIDDAKKNEKCKDHDFKYVYTIPVGPHLMAIFECDNCGKIHYEKGSEQEYRECSNRFNNPRNFKHKEKKEDELN